jgi:hypothetical protein
MSNKKRYILGNCSLIVIDYDCNDALGNREYDISLNTSRPFTTNVEDRIVTFPEQGRHGRDVDIVFTTDAAIFELVDPTLTPIAAPDFDTFVSLLSAEQAACDCCSSSVQLDSTTTNVTPTTLVTAGAASTTAGVWEVSISNIGGANGIIDGQTIPSNVTLVYQGYYDRQTNEMKRLASITYDATGTSFLILEIP